MLLTLPLPVPDRATVRFLVKGITPSNRAATDWSEPIVTLQGPLPEQPPPLQPAKTEPELAVATRFTEVPPPKLALQVAPQLIPEGSLVTMPLPPPVRLSV